MDEAHKPSAARKPSALFTDSLHSDVLLLSCFLNGQQAFPSQPHPNNKDLVLLIDFSCLLSIGNSLTPKAENVNATVANLTKPGNFQSVVSIENVRQDDAMVKSYKGIVKGQKERNRGRQKNKKVSKASGKSNKQMNSAHPVPNAILNPLPNPLPLPHHIDFNSTPKKGRDLLDLWDPANLNSTVNLPK